VTRGVFNPIFDIEIAAICVPSMDWEHVRELGSVSMSKMV
jgi:hypothetical protein